MTARSELGDVFVLEEGGPVFSRVPECNGVVVVFGRERHRTVLSDDESFRLPPSASRQLELPANLANLNRSLHSMRGVVHQSQRHLIAQALAEFLARSDSAALSLELEHATSAWTEDSAFGLLREMRLLSMRLAAKIVFGECTSEHLRLADLIGAYFHLRREASSPAIGATAPRHDLLIAAGEELDRELRDYVQGCRRNAGDPGDGLVYMLSDAARDVMSDDELIGHTSILFTSLCEPVAVGLTWTLLVLSQLPDQRRRLRASAHRCVSCPPSGRSRSPSLSECLINESLRLLPPSAILVRTTSRAVELCGTRLPADCEIVLCPFVAHRDEAVFARAREFDPARWIEARFSQYEYLPFGAGTHSCVGRGIAMHLMTTALDYLSRRFEIVLAGDQAVDWRLHVQFMPRNDPIVRIADSGKRLGRDGNLSGPVRDMLHLRITGG